MAEIPEFMLKPSSTLVAAKIEKTKGILINRITNEFLSFNKSSHTSASINQETIQFVSFILGHLNIIIATTLLTFVTIFSIILVYFWCKPFDRLRNRPNIYRLIVEGIYLIYNPLIMF